MDWVQHTSLFSVVMLFCSGMGVILFGTITPMETSHRHHVLCHAWRTVTLWGSLHRACQPLPRQKLPAAKIFRIIDHKPNIERNGETGLELESVTGQVELKNVDFSYPSRPEVRILSDFSLTSQPERTIALVGSSGSGKSTVVSLIERFYDPTSVGEFNVYLLMEEVHGSHVGQVLLDGHDIKTLKLRWLRQQIGLVSQEPALFATTIKENMLLGRPDATLVEIEEAAELLMPIHS
ncbi:ABC transporter B family member 1 [Vitis vinifera]|uniref:ABC transporter B family member 1 n=1 Tax=Vitis vinifera TaxID=29760 RepID=A0A438I613_VITVI|nr:ABC transporter B family member 1 [Vitis vinifera]